MSIESLGRSGRAALFWCLVLFWGVALYVFASPWRELGGLVSERLRWFHRFALFVSLVAGLTSAGYVRDSLRRPYGLRGATAVRLLFYPAAAVTAAVMTVLKVRGIDDPVGAVTSAFLAWLAGASIAFFNPEFEDEHVSRDPLP